MIPFYFNEWSNVWPRNLRFYILPNVSILIQTHDGVPTYDDIPKKAIPI